MFLILPTPPTTTSSNKAATDRHQPVVPSQFPSHFFDLRPAPTYEELRTQLKSETETLYGKPTNEDTAQLLEQSGSWIYCEKCHSQFKTGAICDSPSIGSSASHARPLEPIAEDKPDSRIDAWVDSVCDFMEEIRFKCVICGYR